jgi:uncharacterized membrane protein YtjA (UPF0391 family)
VEPLGRDGVIAAPASPAIRNRYPRKCSRCASIWEQAMFGWALVFLVVALIAAVFGFGGIAATASSMAQILFVVALILLVISLLIGFVRRAR